MVVSIQGRRMYFWRAVDHEGEVLDLLVQPRRDKAAALKLMRKLLKKQRFAPRVLVTDKLGSYSSGRRELGLSWRAWLAWACRSQWADHLGREACGFTLASWN